MQTLSHRVFLFHLNESQNAIQRNRHKHSVINFFCFFIQEIKKLTIPATYLQHSLCLYGSICIALK